MDMVKVPKRIVDLLMQVQKDGVIQRASELQEVYRLLAAHSAGAQEENVHQCALCGSTGDCKAKDPRLLNDCQGAWYRPAAHPQPMPQTDAARELIEAAKDVLANGHQHDVGGGDVFLGTCDSTERLQRALAGIERSERDNQGQNHD